MTVGKINLVCEILEDGIRNESFSSYQDKVLKALNPHELKEFMRSMAIQLDKDDRIKVSKRNSKGVK